VPPAAPPPNGPDLKRSIGFWGAMGVMIGVIIGSGIFRTPGLIAQELDSPWVILGLWALGGLLCLAGALTYAELAAMYPASGGVYVFIREGFGGVAAFVFGWSYLLLIKPLGAGGIAFVFAEHLAVLLDVQGTPEQKALWNKWITTALLLGLTFINWRGVRLATAFSGVLSAIKFGALAAIVFLTLGMGRFNGDGFAPASTPIGKPVLLGVMSVISSILWTYDGWSDVGAIAGEVKDPQRRLPRVYIWGILAIIAVYLLVNAAYFMVVPIDQMRAGGQADPSYSVATETLRRLVGPWGAVAIAAIVVLSTLGSTHASIMTGARVSYAQARDGLLFRIVGHVHPRWATPDVSLIAQVVLSIVMVWCLGSFQKLADGFVFTMWIFYAMAAAAIFILRTRRPEFPRPFRCPGYPVVPAVFVLVSLGMTALTIYGDHDSNYVHTLPWLGVLAAGVPIYFVWRRLFPATDASARPPA